MSSCRFLLLVCALAASLATPSMHALAWGERGHDLIARVAARIMLQRSKNNKQLQPFLMKEHMLGHLANVPDIYFRALPQAEKIEGPTHYIDLDYLTSTPTLQNLPVHFEQAVALANKQGKELATDIGTAPWRCNQLFQLMTDALREAKSSDHSHPLTEKEIEGPVIRALTYGGILAHYLGDLSQPLHATKDYDGWNTKQGGIHSYFEEAIVNALSLSLDYEVFAAAYKEEPYKRFLQSIPERDRERIRTDPTALTLALAIDSFNRIPTLMRLDRTYALIAASKASPIKAAAERRLPVVAAENFRAFVVERLALGADLVANFWLLAWEQAGKPDLSTFKSFDYALTPTYIAPDYAVALKHAPVDPPTPAP